VTRRLTGFTTTGRLHLGNHLGAMRPLVAGQGDAHSIAMIADLHALTIEHDPGRLRELTREMATMLLAAGVDPARTSVILQSSIPEHTTLHYLLECTTGYGEAARMIQFKEKSAGGGPVRLSLLTYPVLMAADILLYDIQEVPVGDDQNQHLELARTVALRFNRRYGDTFVVPQGVRPESAARVMDLTDPAAKMSKSAAAEAGRIGMLDTADQIRRKIARAVTDTVGVVRHDPERQPGVTNLLTILSELGAPTGPFSSYGDLKRAVTDAVEATLGPIRARYAELSADPGYVDSVLEKGREQVVPIAEATVRRAKRAIGLLD
jgi:tryptophanyl-tRNA synthetase